MDRIELLTDELHAENLCTYYILPLLKINKYKFTSGLNFIDCYLGKNIDSIFVQLRDVQFFGHRARALPNYDSTWKDTANCLFVKYLIPDKWNKDVGLFVKGKYSEFSDEAKEMIKLHSGLQYRVKNDEGIIMTDVRILALDKSSAVREIWEERIGCPIDKDQELLSLPSDSSFIRANASKFV